VAHHKIRKRTEVVADPQQNRKETIDQHDHDSGKEKGKTRSGFLNWLDEGVGGGSTDVNITNGRPSE